MNQARRAIQKRLKRTDMVLEVLDCRLPNASQNPMLAELRGGLPCLRVLTKPDLADPVVTDAWIGALREPDVQVIALNATQTKAVKQIARECRKLVPKRGHGGFPVRVLIVGVPNVGKSTLFNSLSGKKKAEVRDQPAVTRREQVIELEGGIALVDTPGVLWPKLEDQAAAHRLAMSGAIRDAVIDSLAVGRFAVNFFRQYYPNNLQQRYKLDKLSDDPDEVLAAIAHRRGCLTKGVGPDLVKASELLLNELRAGKLGRLSLERPA